jgi:hypothetical protein
LQLIWENKYKNNYARICDLFLSHLYKIIFCKECPRLTKEARKLIKCIGKWYFPKEYTYLRIYGVVATPHVILKYIPTRIVLSEITHQTILHGFNASLDKDVKKTIFIT